MKIYFNVLGWLLSIVTVITYLIFLVTYHSNSVKIGFFLEFILLYAKYLLAQIKLNFIWYWNAILSFYKYFFHLTSPAFANNLF